MACFVVINSIICFITFFYFVIKLLKLRSYVFAWNVKKVSFFLRLAVLCTCLPLSLFFLRTFRAKSSPTPSFPLYASKSAFDIAQGEMVRKREDVISL